MYPLTRVIIRRCVQLPVVSPASSKLSDNMRFISLALTAALSCVVRASLQVVPGGTWTTVSLLRTGIDVMVVVGACLV